jgi:hypothetical protein
MDFYGYNAEEKKTFSASIVMDFYGYNAEEKKTFSASIVFFSYLLFLFFRGAVFSSMQKKRRPSLQALGSFLILYFLI